MCNLYSITKGQAAVIELARAARFERQFAANARRFSRLSPIVRNAPDNVHELILARWGMPGPPQFGGAPIDEYS